MSEAKKPAAKVVSEVAAAEPAKASPAIGSAAYNELSSAERTQIVADDRFKGPNRFRCGHRDCPSIVVAAHSAEEARARYQDLCGILHSESPFQVEAA